MHILFALLASLALLIPGTGMVAAGMIDSDGSDASQSQEGPDLDWDDRFDLDDFDDRFDFDLEFDDDHGTFQFRDQDLAFGDGSGTQGNRQAPNATDQNAQGQDGTDAQQNQKDQNSQNSDSQNSQDQNADGQNDTTTQPNRGNRPGKGQGTQNGTDTQQNQSQGSSASVII